jgi:acetylcholinesterase
MFFPVAFLLGALSCVHAAPQIKLGKTTLTGLDITGLGLEFFGGIVCLLLCFTNVAQVYVGIPFAEPPLGKLRLKPTVLKTRLDVETFDASSFGKGCLQPATDITEFSEDCLTINVYRPKGVLANANLPVLFWTYGGGFQDGASLIYNGSAIVAQSVARGTPLIYVNYNYRLGPLGFPQGQEADDRKALNLALRDQIAALQWVQANIGIFGGDKKKVSVK